MTKKWLLWLVTILFLWMISSRLDELEALGQTMMSGQWQWLLAAVGLQFIYYIAYSAVYKFAFDTVDVQSSVWELTPVTYASLFANLAAPTGGAAGAALYVDEVARRGQSRTRATVGVLLMLVIDFGVLALMVLFSLGLLYQMRDLQLYEVVATLILVCFVGIMAAALTLGLWRPSWLRWSLDRIHQLTNLLGRLIRRPALLDAEWSARNAAEFEEAAQAMSRRPWALTWTTIVALIAHALDLLSLYTLFLAFHQPVTWEVLMVGYAMNLLFTIVSPTPNGVGVVEGLLPVIYTSMGLPLATATVISLTFRGITFWLPMLAGFFLLRRLKLFTPTERSLAEQEQPHFVAVATAAMGVINVLSGATPGWADRLQTLGALSPLMVRHGSRLTSVIAGFGLIILARGLWRRKEMAWWLTVLLLLASIVIHLVKGLDYEEAALAAILLVVLLTQRARFHARSDPPSFRQGMSVLATASIFTLAYGAVGFYLLDRHFQVDYRFSTAIRQTVVMFTQFYDPGLQPLTGFGRYFANSIYVIGAVTLGYAFLLLLRPVFVHNIASASERRRATMIVEAYGHTSLARFTLFPDKRYFFSPGGSVIAYATKGRTAIALGDPIGPPADVAAAITAFQAFCGRNDWLPAFYQTLPDYLDRYRAAGFTALCIGHEGIVHLDTFTTSGGPNHALRTTANHLARLGYQTIMHEPPLDQKLLAELRAVSDEWLTLIHGTEQRFALGAFDDDYVRASQVMAVHGADGAVVAFANIVPEYQRNEITIDLMRHRRTVVSGTMEFLFIGFLQWAQGQGYASFNLGLSALSGVGEAPDDPALERALHYIYGHINRFYNFQGLHAFKEKFHPEWSPRYLVYANVARLPRTLTALARATAGDNFWLGYGRDLQTWATEWRQRRWGNGRKAAS